MENNEEKKVEETVVCSGSVVGALKELQGVNGMYDLYDTFLTKMEDMLLIGLENISLTDDDTLSYLRISRMLRKDLRRLSVPEAEDDDIIAENI